MKLVHGHGEACWPTLPLTQPQLPGFPPVLADVLVQGLGEIVEANAPVKGAELPLLDVEIAPPQRSTELFASSKSATKGPWQGGAAQGVIVGVGVDGAMGLSVGVGETVKVGLVVGDNVTVGLSVSVPRGVGDAVQVWVTLKVGVRLTVGVTVGVPKGAGGVGLR